MAEVPAWAQALGKVPSGLFIVTAGTGAEATGFLASWVQQVGFEPPAVSIAVKNGRYVADLVRSGGAFCVTVLDAESKHLLGHFARGFEPGAPAFEGLETGTSAAGVPYPAGGVAHLECKLLGEVDWSDHTIFCGEVVDGAARDGEPMTHVRTNGASY